jgi:hypothetical protein
LPDKETAASNGKGREKILSAALIVIVLLAAAAFLYQYSKRPHYRKIEIAQPKIKKVTVTGEVVDAWCYASQTMGPGRGEGHKACALACSYGGVTMGILEDGTKDLYVAAKSSKAYKGCNELLIPYVAQKVTVTGWVGTMGGCRMLKIETLTPVPETTIVPRPEIKSEPKTEPNH